MAATHGNIGEYDPQKEDWTSYSKRLAEYFTANDVELAAKNIKHGMSVNLSANEEPRSTTKANREGIC